MIFVAFSHILCIMRKLTGCDSWSIVLFGFLCLQFSPVQSGIEKFCMNPDETRPHVHGLCGSELTHFLSVMCEGIYYRPDKRGINDKEANNLDQFPVYSPLEGILLGKREAFSYLSSSHSRSKRSRDQFTGIVCECCFNQCSVPELLGYCGWARKKRNVIADQLPFKMND